MVRTFAMQKHSLSLTMLWLLINLSRELQEIHKMHCCSKQKLIPYTFKFQNQFYFIWFKQVFYNNFLLVNKFALLVRELILLE